LLKEEIGREVKAMFLASIKKFLTARPKVAITNHNEGKKSMENKNYTEAQEARMAEFEFIDAAIAKELADEFGKNQKSVIAKAVRMGIYKAKEKTSKTGGKIESKEQIVADIATLVGTSLTGLEKASKQSLLAIRDKLAA
jgi:hypothetical protein